MRLRCIVSTQRVTQTKYGPFKPTWRGLLKRMPRTIRSRGGDMHVRPTLSIQDESRRVGASYCRFSPPHRHACLLANIGCAVCYILPSFNHLCSRSVDLQIVSHILDLSSSCWVRTQVLQGFLDCSRLCMRVVGLICKAWGRKSGSTTLHRRHVV